MSQKPPYVKFGPGAEIKRLVWLALFCAGALVIADQGDQAIGLAGGFLFRAGEILYDANGGRLEVGEETT